MVIGLDIGGTKITGVLFNGKRVVRELTIVTPKNLPEFKHNIRKLVEFLSVGKSIQGLGVGIAGRVDRASNKVFSSPNISFVKNLDFGELFREPKRVVLENDANCFALGEARLGQGENLQNFIGITLGTGIGGGIISRGKIYEGVHGGAGEIGHIFADFKHSYEYYFQKARDRGNYAEIAKICGNLFSLASRVVDTQAIIVGGSVATNAHKRFMPGAVKIMKTQLKHPNIFPKILVSKLKNAGAIGAGLLLK